ncbi:MAG: HEAT repeat domain-containing protein [Rhodopirellula sp.]|nr:HEAT repeat domain-containing protein [Rhodopirellula sp.]
MTVLFRGQFLLLFLFVLVAPSAAFAQRNLTDIPNPDPEIERQSFIVADGWEVNLYAADPQIAKPIQMNFDPQGRLWIASSEIYPHIKPGEKANDRILVVEDKDGDGTADSTTVFADGLLIPTGVLPGDGGVYAANSTELVHFSDTDGDGKSDHERVVLSGFGTEDTHHILHTLRWGPDGMLYMNQSIYIHSHIETPYGTRRLNAGGIWQFRPETMELNVFARGWVNTWGHQFDKSGQSFVTDGAGGEGINYVIPGAAYPTAQGIPRIFHGLNPGSPKYCGLAIVSGRQSPDDWQGDLITNDFRGHRVCRFKLSDDGAGYASRELGELIKTPHVAFRPIDVAMGPDGAIYIADWYNPIIQHGEVDFRDPRRDHTHGRIWRVSYKGSKPAKRPQLVDAPVPELFEQLKSPEDWTREQTRRVLKERGRDAVLGPLKEWTATLDNDHHKLEALWLHQALREPHASLLQTLIADSKVPEVRAAAVRVAQHWQNDLPAQEILSLVGRCVHDAHPRVRLEAVRVLGNIGSVEAITRAMEAVDHPTDRFLDYALWLTAWETRHTWLPLVESGQLTFHSPAQLTFALMAADAASAVPQLILLLKSDDLSGQRWNEAVDLVVARGNASQYESLLGIAAGESDVSQRHTLLRAIVVTSQQRKLRPAGDLKSIDRLLVDDQPAEVRALAAEAVGAWKISRHAATLKTLAKAAATPLSLRTAAIGGLAALGSAEATTLLTEFVSAESEPYEVREAAVLGIAARDPAIGAKLAIDLLTSSRGSNPTRLIQTLVQHKQGPGSLAVALKGRTLPADAAKLAVRAIDSSGRKLDDLKSAISAAGSIDSGAKKLSPEEMAAFVADVRSQGDRTRGEAVYRRASLACMKCHAIGGAGGKVGPDMGSIGGSAQIDYLIESLLDPNAKVKEGFHTVIVVTDDGKTFSGIKVRQTDSQLILRNAEGVETAIALDAIDEQVNGTSLMPAGLADRLTHQELVDVVRFLSELGKVGGLQVSRDRIVRNWQVLLPSDDVTFKLRRTRLSSVTEDDPAFQWQPAYSRVTGELPLDDQPKVMYRGPFQNQPSGLHFLRFSLDAGTAGKVELALNSTAGVTVWMDGVQLESADVTSLDLKTGRHRITLMISQTERSEPVLVRINDVAGSNAQVQLLTD